MNILESIRDWVGMLVQIFLALIPLAIVLSILVGARNIGFVGDVVTNLIALINQFGSAGLVGLIALGIVLSLFSYLGSDSGQVSKQY
jgi:hypothetical protein